MQHKGEIEKLNTEIWCCVEVECLLLFQSRWEICSFSLSISSLFLWTRSRSFFFSCFCRCAINFASLSCSGIFEDSLCNNWWRYYVLFATAVKSLMISQWMSVVVAVCIRILCPWILWSGNWWRGLMLLLNHLTVVCLILWYFSRSKIYCSLNNLHRKLETAVLCKVAETKRLLVMNICRNVILYKGSS